MKRLIPLLLVTLFFFVFMSGPPIQAQTKMVVGKAVAKTFGFLPADIGKDQGMFKKRGIDAEVVAFRGGAHLVQGIAAGSVDIGLDGTTSTLIGIAKGTPIKVIAASRNSLAAMALIVSDRSGIKALEDLKGKKIGVTSHGAITDWLPIRLSENQGWPKEAITRVPLGPFTNQVAALKRGEIDGFVWTVDGGWEVEKERLGKVLLSFGDVFPQVDFELMSATDKLLREKPELVKAFAEAFFESVRYMRDNKDYTIKKTAEILEISPDIARRVYDYDMKNLPDRPSLKREGLTFILASLVRDGILPKAPGMEILYDARFVTPR